ncbi:LGFP repeat-containing protein [Rhodococcus sp. PBTS 1]|nr:LGFP repeat-containing protein [Rhodococcus sp. PBTS 1]AMY19560.1 hypothetical protein A3Q40_02186 [Rhodococcus sp. PBTS 1]
MRSDREEVPAPFTKEDADRAEIAEARLRTSRSAVACQVYWPSWFNVCGEIRDKYNSLGGPGSFLSYPSSGNIVNPGNTGERVTFLNGPIYWSAAGGAHPVVNSFLNRWGIHGYEGGWLGYPTTDEIVLPDGGRRQEFQQGAIYVSFQNAIGSAIRNGPIRDKWNAIGGNAPGGSVLGYITGDEIGLPDGQGRMARFERGVIYWHPSYGAHEVTGFGLLTWAFDSYERGTLGYPTSAPQPSGSGLTQQFQNGQLRQTNPLASPGFIEVGGFVDGDRRSVGGRFCSNGYFGWNSFDSLRTSLDSWYARNGRVWQVADDDEVWDVWCRVTSGEASIRYTDNTTSIEPGPRYDLDDGTISYFRTTSTSGGYAIDFNVPSLSQVWKVHVAQ